jgi:hypothetical protein
MPLKKGCGKYGRGKCRVKVRRRGEAGRKVRELKRGRSSEEGLGFC